MSVSPSDRVEIVPVGEFHFEVRVFDGQGDERYRSWSLPVNAAEAVTRWWSSHSHPLGETPPNGDSSSKPEIKTNEIASVSLREVKGKSNILPRYQGTPIADWLCYHNLGDGRHSYDSPELLIITCMDFRIDLHVPKKFAYVLRLAGANLRHREFDVACALAFAGIRHICVVGHTDCAMESLKDKRQDFVSGLERVAGWSKGKADLQFDLIAPRLTLPHVASFTRFQAGWLERRFPGVVVSPLIYDVKDGSLSQIMRQQ